MLKFFLVVLFLVGLHGQERPDFLIVQELSQLTVLDRYMQEVDSKDFLPSTPWEIVEPNTLLGDQFTRAMHTSFSGKSYYIVLDGEGNLPQISGFWDIFTTDPEFEIPKALSTKPFDLDESAN